jgi:hypothetical protein
MYQVMNQVMNQMMRSSVLYISLMSTEFSLWLHKIRLQFICTRVYHSVCWNPVDSSGIQRILRIPVESGGFRWIPADSGGIHFDQIYYVGIHWNPLESTGQMDSTGFH